MKTVRALLVEALIAKFPGKLGKVKYDDVIDAMEVKGSDRKKWKNWFYNMMANQDYNISEDRLSPLLEALGMTKEQLLKGAKSDAGGGGGDDAAVAPEVAVINAFLKRMNFDTTTLAKSLLEDSQDPLPLTSAIDDFLAGIGEMPENLMKRIAAKFQVDPVTLEVLTPNDGVTKKFKWGIMGKLERVDGKSYAVFGGHRLEISNEEAFKIILENNEEVLGEVLDYLFVDQK